MELDSVQNSQKYLQNQSFAPVPNQEDTGEGGSAIDFWGILRRRFFLISFFILVSIGAGVLYMLNATKIYTANAKVQIFRKSRSVATDVDNIANALIGNGNAADAKRHLSSFVSMDNLREVLVEQNVIQRNTFKDISDKIDKEVLGYISKNLVISQDKQNENLYHLAFSTPYSEDAPKFLNELIRAYRTELVTNYQSDVSKSIDAIEKLISNYSNDLEQVEKKLEEFRKSHKLNVVSDAGSSAANIGLNNTGEELRVAEKELKELKDKLHQVDAFKDAGHAPSHILNVVLKINEKERKDYGDTRKDDHEERYKSQLAQLENQYKLYSKKLGPKNAKIVAIVENIKSMKTLLAGIGEEKSNDIEEMEPADRLEVEHEKIRSDIVYKTITVNQLKAKMALFKEEAESIVRNRKIESDLVEKRKRLELERKDARTNLTKMRIEGDGEVYKFEVMSLPSEGELSHPLPLKVFGISLVLGCLSGFGLAYLVDLADKTFRSPHEIIKSLNLALIGHVPVIQTPNRKKLANQDVHPVICSFHKPKSQSAEAFRAVRTSLYFSVQGQKHQVIQVTSPTPGDGKSTLAANLATVIAQSGKSVLLVDSDFRRPSVQKIFKVEETPGFSDVLVQQVTVEEAVQQTPVEGLEILACGNKPMQPSELLTSHRLPEVIDELREMYDFVIIDTPPVLLVTDPCPVAANVDGVICAMRIKKNVRVNAERMVEILRSVNANILGVVVNGVGAQGNYASQYNYGAYQAGYSQYGYGAYGYGGYGQSEKVYDDGRKASLTVPRQQLIESHADDDFMS